MLKLGKLTLLTAARNQAKRHPGPVHTGIDKVASAVRSKISDRHAGKVDKGASLAKKVITGRSTPKTARPALDES